MKTIFFLILEMSLKSYFPLLPRNRPENDQEQIGFSYDEVEEVQVEVSDSENVTDEQSNCIPYKYRKYFDIIPAKTTSIPELSEKDRCTK